MLGPFECLVYVLYSYHNNGNGMVWYGMVWYGMVWYGMVWYGNSLFDITEKIYSCCYNT